MFVRESVFECLQETRLPLTNAETDWLAGQSETCSTNSEHLFDGHLSHPPFFCEVVAIQTLFVWLEGPSRVSLVLTLVQITLVLALLI